MLTRSERLTIVAALIGCVLAGVLTVIQAGSVVRFTVAAAALALLATLVGQATEQLGERLGPGPPESSNPPSAICPSCSSVSSRYGPGSSRLSRLRWSAQSWATAC